MLNPTSHIYVPHKNHGFTLIELSIVIVIIALLIGGVMMGRELINSANIRAQISQIETMEVSFNTFRLKYNCLPGDCSQAVARVLGTNATHHNGDGNGSIVTLTPQFNSGHRENINFFFHLYQAGLSDSLVSGYGGESGGMTEARMQTFFPASKFARNYIVASRFPIANSNFPPGTACQEDGGSGFAIVGQVGGWGWNWERGAISVQNIEEIDRKIDDGAPLQGSVRLAPQNTNGAWAPLSPLATAGCGHLCVSSTYEGTHTSCDGNLNDNHWVVALFTRRF